MTDNINKISEQIHSLLQVTTKLDVGISNLSNEFKNMENKIDNLITEYAEIKVQVEIIKKENEGCFSERLGFVTKVGVLEEKCVNLKDKIHEIEMNLEKVKFTSDSSKTNWKTVLDIIFKICVGVGTGYILYMAGIGVHLL